MAATDQTYRNQKMLDIVFAVSGILTLLSLVGMFAQDYFREFKTEQRQFRDVEAAMAERAVLALLPSDKIAALREAEGAQGANAPALAERRKALYEARKQLLAAEDELTQRRLDATLTRERDVTKSEEERRQATDQARQQVSDAEAKVKEARAQRDKVIEESDDAVKAVLQAEDALLDYLDRFRNARKAVRDARAAAEEQRAKTLTQVQQAQVNVATADGNYRSIKASYDSKESLYNIAQDEYDHTPRDRQKDLQPHLDALKKELDSLRQKRDDAKNAFDAAKDRSHQAELDKALAEKIQTQAEADAKKLQADVERYEKLVAQKRWKFTDWLLSQPVIDAFASPYRIQQYTLAEYPIDYSFKYVTRYDRCTTCHEGAERGTYEKPALEKLTQDPGDLQANLTRFRQILQDRRNRGEDVPPDRSKGESGGFDLDDLPAQVTKLPLSELTPARVTQFCAHPRLDLFVDSNSPHPADKFGCTSCHSGQGSATDFKYAAHTPNSPKQKEAWEDEHGWFPSHFWDFPMYPKRFKEATCLKCHHQVTDLIRYGNQVEAPKLVRGYNLVRDSGCFGCHEIAGMKRGREIGPDLRLEPTIPVDQMEPMERAKLDTDKDNPPGTMRKVGPSLFRLAEKTNEEWVARWIWSPRGFRPSTRMPHFYGVSNNNAEALDGTDQKAFPAAEVRAIAFYLMHESDEYLEGRDPYRRTNKALVEYYQNLERKQGALADNEKKELAAAEERLDPANAPLLELRLGKGEKPRRITAQLVDGEGRTVQLPAPPGDEAGRKKERERGRKLFSERGCLACHFHEGTTKNGTADVPAVVSQADFGPDLSHVAAKLGVKEGDEASARRWLVQWILNPRVHHPRTRMPYTHLAPDEAAAVAVWLLSEGKDWKGEQPPDVELTTYKALAKVFLSRLRNPQEVEQALKRDPAAQQRETIWLDGLRPDSDEAILQKGATKDNLRLYVGRKAISRYGCFGCHNVPGFETSKPIGTPLNDWGKKDPERLAFEDIVAYVRDHHQQVEQRDDPGDPARPSKEWAEAKPERPPYEQFFYEELEHQQRDGFLNQKLREPRSYDYHRFRVWDDRLRMPQFHFGHTRRLEDEGDEQYGARQEKEEAEAREAVMTFVLGLVAEPVPAEYLNRMTPDRLAEVQGRKLVEQFNCVGCHEVRPGVYAFKPTPAVLDRLEDDYRAAAKSFPSDFGSGPNALPQFTAHNAWRGLAPPWPDRLLAFGVNYRKVKEDEAEVGVVRLAEALHFVTKDRQERDLPADSVMHVPEDLLARNDTLGGAFAHLMVGYLNKRDSTLFKIDAFGESADARSALPPQLFREGERTQPDWLFQFIRNPSVIRPPERMLLRMPKFNINDEEARTLANYFNSQDKVGNPGIGLTYPYLKMPERDEDYLLQKTQEYKKRLGEAKLKQRAERLTPLWEQSLKDELGDAQRKLAAAEDAVKAAKDPDVKQLAEQNRDAFKKEVESLKRQVDRKDVSRLRQDWEEKGVYLADAYRLLTNTGSPCLGCHQVGDVPAKEAKGPNLRLSAERLRPGWTERWMANPLRLMHPTLMPQNFPRDKQQYNEFFEGSSLEQVQALRDVLLNFPTVTTRPENRYYSGSGGGS
jgi:cytochrome c1